MTRVAIYLRVSTDQQTTENQARELAAVATGRGWEVVGTYEDAGISGSKGRDQRPAFDRLLKDASRGKFDLIAAWSVDRLGRSLQDLVGFMGELQAVGVGLYLHQQALDTTTRDGEERNRTISVRTLRREALASAELGGERVDWEDLVVAQLDPTPPSQELRPTTVAPPRLIATADRLDRGIGLPDP